MTEFMINIQKHESDWEKNIAEDENNKNVKISNKNDQFEVSSDEKFEKKMKKKNKVFCILEFNKFHWNCYFKLLFVILILSIFFYCILKYCHHC